MTVSTNFTLNELLDEASVRLKGNYKNAGIDSASLSIVWGHTCIFIEEQLLKGKAVTIQGLGTFTYIHKKQELGNKGVRVTRTPVFVVADAFCQTNDVRKDTFSNLTTSVPAISLNNSLIASQSETSRDIVMDFQKEAIRGIGAAIKSSRGVSIELKNIGTLVYSGGTLKVSFNSDFVAQFQVTATSKNTTASFEESLPENIDPVSFKPNLSPSLSPKLKVNNFVSSPSASRNSTPRDDFREKASSKSSVILPQVERPRNPLIKLRANSDSALRNVLLQDTFAEDLDTRREENRYEENGEEENGEEETCDHCKLATFNQDQVRTKRNQEKAQEEASLKAQKSALQLMEEKEQYALRMQKARREDADFHNRTTLVQKQDTIVKQKKLDFYGDVFYARKPDTPEHVKKSQYKSALQEQISDKQSKQKQQQVESKKEHEVFHETQKQADERARKMKLDEKQKQKDHSEYLVQQMTQKGKTKDGGDTIKFERSVNPSISPTLLNSLSPLSHTYAEDLFRPSTADRNVRRRSFDANALDHHRDAIIQKKQRDDEEKARQAKEQLENARLYAEMLQQQQQEDINKKLQTRELLRSAWDTQMVQKRSNTLAELTLRNSPMRTSLDLGQLQHARHPTHMTSSGPCHKCKKCGRGFEPPGDVRRFRRSTGDFRISK